MQQDMQQAVTSAKEDILLTRKDAARILGVSVHTVDRYVCERLIPHVKLPRGGRQRALVRFRRSDLAKWIERSVVKVNPFAA